MTDAFGLVINTARSCRDMVFSIFKPAFDCVEPILDLTRPTCAPGLDCFKNLVAVIEGK
jgi:hypothetical protein